MKKLKPGAPHLPKLLRLSVPVRQAHIEDMYGEYPVEKRDALCSTKTLLCACIVENSGENDFRLPQRKRSLVNLQLVLRRFPIARMYPLDICTRLYLIAPPQTST